MPAPVPVWQEVREQIPSVTRPTKLRATSVERRALLVTGMIAAHSTVVARIADELLAVGLTGATEAASIARRVRRTLNERRLEAEAWYQPALAQALDWSAAVAGHRTVVMIGDDSSQADRIHVLRLSLA